MKSKAYTVYIIASKTRVLYIGVTSNLTKRIWEHKTHLREGFASKYNCERLVWFSVHGDPWEAIAREKELKGWVRRKKLALVKERNPDWNDLADHLWPQEYVDEHRTKNLAARSST
jgi:putative endonuclease